LEPWRAVAPSAFLALWMGFVLLPGTHPALRAPATLILAALVGFGAELCARTPARGGLALMTRGTLWIIPAAATAVLVMLLGSLGSRIGLIAPLLAVIVVGTMALQAIEVSGPSTAASIARSLNTGLAFAVAFAVFGFMAVWDAAASGFIDALVGALVAVVIVRGCHATWGERITYVGLSAMLVAQMGLMLQDAQSPFLAAGILLLGLYAVATTAQAMLDRAPRRAYVEVVLVTCAGLVLAAVSLAHH
jgi:hypothetical protein